MYRFNKSLVERKHDRSLFNANTFEILRFNEAGYRLITEFRNADFSLDDFLRIACSYFPNEDSARAFFHRCLQQNVFCTSVEIPA
ncbi:hypothetical protein PPN31114_02085 [Pandoraea pneumonica]|uniref:Uncharacterized protein n=1 Tax=Pandoraea pneumonica TaxID=2508299 RepID=A0A5E4UJS3_9BURK|nr:hypothetical protein PPN31114_02085 [Pandoraea pneumonica]